jgi:DNA-binding CsgD family transcriptional regulator
MSNEGMGSVGGARGSPASAARSVASITVVAATGRPSNGSSLAGGGAVAVPVDLLSRVMDVVRSDDRVCPISPGRSVVWFGTTAGRVRPETLAERMVSALTATPGQGARPGPEALVVSVGLASACGSVGLAVLTGRSLSASRSGWRSVARSDRAVAVTVLDLDGAGAASRAGIRRRSRKVAPLVGVTRLRWQGDGNQWSDGADREGTGTKLLVLDGDLVPGGEPGPVAGSVSRQADALGFTTFVRGLGEYEPSRIGALRPDVVVVVVDGAASGAPFVSWTTGPWHLSAVATTAAVRTGARVIAVSTAGGAGALAGCVNRGATGLFDIDGIWPQLQVRNPHSPEAAPNSELAGGSFSGRRPPGFDALLTLTESERRVLFYLTGGWSAQSVADELVVSLTTVRSHIRSMLRKLGVRSQLAAVAIANGLEFESSHRMAEPAAGGRT